MEDTSVSIKEIHAMATEEEIREWEDRFAIQDEEGCCVTGIKKTVDVTQRLCTSCCAYDPRTSPHTR